MAPTSDENKQPPAIIVRAPTAESCPFPDDVYDAAAALRTEAPDRAGALADFYLAGLRAVGHPEYTSGPLSADVRATWEAAQDLLRVARDLPPALCEATQDVARALIARAEGKAGGTQLGIAWVGAVGLERYLRRKAEPAPLLSALLLALDRWNEALERHSEPAEGGRVPCDLHGARKLTETLGCVRSAASAYLSGLIPLPAEGEDVRFVNLGKPTDELVLVQRVLAAVGGLMPSVETQPGLLPAGWHHAEEAETESGTRRTLRPRLEIKPAEMIPARITAALERERVALREMLGLVKGAGAVDVEAIATAAARAAQKPAGAENSGPADTPPAGKPEVSPKVRAIRIVTREPGISNADLAKRVGVHRSTVGRWKGVKVAREQAASNPKLGWKVADQLEALDPGEESSKLPAKSRRPSPRRE